MINDKELVVPGQVIAESMEYLPGEDIIREKEKLIATKVGMASLSGRLIKLVPLTGPYVPKRDDIVIGKVTSIGLSGWRVDIGWAFEANLSIKDASSDYIAKGADLSKYLSHGDYIMAQIVNIASMKIIDLSIKGPGLRKLGEGRIIKIGSTKVPRVIGKQGSMINLIKEYTGCKISVGQNGFIWISGDNVYKEDLAVRTIKKIEKESFMSGLTDRIKEYLEKESGSLQ
ncbi:MAG TPA: exosome complex RNA-binding protein Rrp4 [Candidatus Nanoarchaeia archaeon]|nr:exosome complex RNA-binding protein Rrp4 [Candidatus Nanoarchaeia archaeon]